ncbi:Carboxylic ester hydrolase [Pseudozyma hubeiensis]|nr:Carboxylic ester hydrolase [Pseudozyma hubeiensis]
MPSVLSFVSLSLMLAVCTFSHPLSELNKRYGSSLQQETGFPGKPTAALMYTYKPTSYKAGNPVIVALHHCQGTGPSYFGEYSDWPNMSDQKGFMMIFGSSPGNNGTCWDVSSRASLKHNGGGDSQTIANMVSYAKSKYGTGPAYLVGHSSGAMLTQVMAADYPDLFVAGAEYSGVPSTCFATNKAIGQDWNATCAQGKIIEPQSYWVSKVKGQYSGYGGQYPRMMLVHGDADQTINFNNHGEAIKQWTGMHGLNPDQPSKTYALASDSRYLVSEYGSSVMAVRAKDFTHDNPAKVSLTLQFFGI